MNRHILIILILFIVSCTKDGGENQEQELSTSTEQDSLKELSTTTSIDEGEVAEGAKQEHDSLEHAQLFNPISKNTNQRKQFSNTDSLNAFEVKEVGYFDGTNYAFIYLTSPTDSLKEYHQSLEKSIGSTIAEGSWFTRQSLSDDFINRYYPHVKYDSLDLFSSDNKYFGSGYFNKIEFITINYENTYSVSGIIALYKFNKTIPSNRYYGLVGQYTLNKGVTAEQVYEAEVFTDHILKNNNLPVETPFAIQWYMSGYDKVYTNVYYDQGNYEVDSYLIETDAKESKIAMNLHGEEIREFIATGIFVNNKPVLFLFLSSPFSDGGSYCVAIFNGTEYELTC